MFKKELNNRLTLNKNIVYRQSDKYLSNFCATIDIVEINTFDSTILDDKQAAHTTITPYIANLSEKC